MDKFSTPAAKTPRENHPGPRSTPVVAEGKVCTFGVQGTLSCLDAATGQVAWRKATKNPPQFFAASSPVSAEGKCIACIGGGRGAGGGIVAYDLNTGEETWKWTGEGAAYGSPVLMTVDGNNQVVSLMANSLVGVSLADGKLLWKTAYKSRYNSETPVVDGQTVYCSGPMMGSVAFKITKQGDAFEAKQVWKKSESAGMYNTPVLKDGLLYGLTSGRGGQGGTNIYCMDAQTGEVLWTDKASRGECSGIFDAGSVLLALTSDSRLLAFKPSKTMYEELAKYKVADSKTWALPILTDKRVFVRDEDSVILWTFE